MTEAEELSASSAPIGSERAIVDEYLDNLIDDETRADIWRAAQAILAHGPIADASRAVSVGLALGYVQSGKTTTITALSATAADDGYRVIVALLGGTNLLLGQNQERIENALDIAGRRDYRWKVEKNPKGRAGSQALSEWLERERVLFIPVLKHAGRIRDLATALDSVAMDKYPTVVIDDEADQASLNTGIRTTSESRTYEAIGLLRSALPSHLYVQFTATPYAPLLLEADDPLLPEFVEFLHPGPGYIGGREFFVDFAERVVRTIPALDEQPARNLPVELPRSLEEAFGSFIAGAALLLHHDRANAPVSMMVHSTQRNDVQARYHFLLERLLRRWRRVIGHANDVADIPGEIVQERTRLAAVGAVDVSDADFLDAVRYAIREVTPWLVNSVSALNRVDWNVAPLHVLVGGNKLDRGFTVEGLTVTYLNRPTSVQIDTMEQRARAFGYRGDQLPYCQFFATARTIKVLRNVVYTEYDLRARLQDHIEAGGSVESWAAEVGLLLPSGTKPTRPAVVQALSGSITGWHSLRQPSLDHGSIAHNHQLIEETGLLDALPTQYGRLAFRTAWLPLQSVIERVIEPWAHSGYSPGWRHSDIVEALRRQPEQTIEVPLVLMEGDDGRARVRKWNDEIGFINLYQGEDVNPQPGRPFYAGDQTVPHIEDNPERVALQVHRVVRRDHPEPEMFTLAAYVGDRPIVRRSRTP